MAVSKNSKVHGIIHTASAAAAAAGGGLAQLPGSDSALIVPIQTAMIVSIAKVHGHKITEAAAADLLLTFLSTMIGRKVSQLLIGWIPGVGNAINATTAAVMTEAIGWAADTHFEK